LDQLDSTLAHRGIGMAVKCVEVPPSALQGDGLGPYPEGSVATLSTGFLRRLRQLPPDTTAVFVTRRLGR